MSAPPELLVEAPCDGVVRLRLNRPERLHALGRRLVDQLLRAIPAAIADGARVLVLAGSGRSFCVGADLKERQAMGGAEKIAHNRAINAAADLIAAAPVPTVAALNGMALGGGCELALACDIRIAAAGIRIGLTEARIGAIPGAGGTQRLPRLIGVSRALDMMLTGEPVAAERAMEIGLVNAVAPPDAFEAVVLQYAGLLASRSRGAAAALKQVVYRGIERPLAEGLALEFQALRKILASCDYAEGLAAFAERRPPLFSNPARGEP